MMGYGSREQEMRNQSQDKTFNASDGLKNLELYLRKIIKTQITDLDQDIVYTNTQNSGINKLVVRYDRQSTDEAFTLNIEISNKTNDPVTNQKPCFKIYMELGFNITSIDIGNSDVYVINITNERLHQDFARYIAMQNPTQLDERTNPEVQDSYRHMKRCILLARNMLHIFSALGRQIGDYTESIAWKFKVNTSTIGYDNPGNSTARLSIDSWMPSSIAIIPTTKKRHFQIDFSLDSFEDKFTIVSDHVENRGDILKQKAEVRSNALYNHIKSCLAAPSPSFFQSWSNMWPFKEPYHHEPTTAKLSSLLDVLEARMGLETRADITRQ
jgi:hypothetical protein